MISQKSIAILPFINLSAEADNQYFADGISEELIIALSKVKGLKVTSRTSSFTFRDSSLDVRLIGNKLGVSTILEGSIRNQGDRVRISVQLIRTDTGFQIYSERFDRELSDIFELQDEISRLIAERIRENFGHFEIKDELVKTQTRNSDAYSSYLKGRYYQFKWTQDGLQKALASYKKSISLDANFPMPYLGLCQCFLFLVTWNFTDRIKGLYMAHHFLSKVGAEHKELSELQYTKGLFHFLGRWEFEEASSFFSKALELNPNDSDTLQAQAGIFNATGKFKEALKVIKKALLLDPNSANHYATKATTHYLSKEYSTAIQVIDSCPESGARTSMLMSLKAVCLLLLKDEVNFKQLITGFENQEFDNYQHLWNVFISKGKEEEVPLHRISDHYLPIESYRLLFEGHKKEALKKVTEAVEIKNGRYINYGYDPIIASIKAQPDFPKIADYNISVEFLRKEETPFKTEQSSLLSESEIILYEEKLKKVMEIDKGFLTQEVTLRMVSDWIDLHPNKLSWLLNDRIGLNFNDYINTFRLLEFQKKAVDPALKNLTLLGLAFESGFNSKSTFNDFFKKKTGMTPRVWLKKQ
ncbi:MAG: helix-turn-helix domain-containing protein [Balneolaceae bacterium]